jgi:Family of unknown function (DUF5906)
MKTDLLRRHVPRATAVQALLGAPEPSSVQPNEPADMALAEFYSRILPAHGRYVLFQNRQNTFFNTLDELIAATERRIDTQGLYFATASYGDDDARTQANVIAIKAHRLDLDAGVAKFAKDPKGVYETHAAARAGLMEFVRATGIVPTLIVASGEGLHVYYELDESVTAAEWKPVAEKLKAVCKAMGLRADPTVTADEARILRAPGTLHKNGNRVEVLKDTGRTYSNAKLDAKLTALLPVQEFPIALVRKPKGPVNINDDILAVTSPPASLAKVADHCSAVAAFRDTKGNIPEPLWRLCIGVGKYCEVDGEELTHEWSSGYPGYKPDETQEKYDRWDTPPATCAAFNDMHDGCASCKYRGKITTPKQLGYVRAVPAAMEPEAASTVDGATLDCPSHIATLNQRYAQIRRGDGVAVLDMQSVVETASGTRTSPSYLSIAAFRALLAGKFAPRKNEDDTPIPLASAWLNHPARRMYPNGVVFLPEGQPPAGTFNLWQGFGVAPEAGDVSPWLESIEQMIPDAQVRDYVVRWFAYKVQHPGAVPGTIPLLTGPKGCGKNSAVEPVVRIFGSHGRVFDDAEQVAGRFTGHLQSVAFAVLDEALFAGDPKQNDRIKARVTATTAVFEAKGVDPVSGVNRCAFISLSNHLHVWAASADERRAVVVECSGALIGKREFWRPYYAWLDGPGPAALLHYLRVFDLSGFEVRDIPRSGALARQVRLTAMRDPAVAWWHATLDEGALTLRNGVRLEIPEDRPFEVCKSDLRGSFDAHGARQGDWSRALAKLKQWAGDGEMAECRPRQGSSRLRLWRLPELGILRARMSAMELVTFDSVPSEE